MRAACSLVVVVSSLSFALAGCPARDVAQPEPLEAERPTEPEAHPQPAPPAPTPEEANVDPNAPQPSPAESGPLASASNAFSMDLWQRLRGEQGNLAVSPASIWIALAMTEGGAQGRTATQMSRVLHMPASTQAAHDLAGRQLAAWNARHPDYTLRIANRLFGERSFRFEQPFLQLTRETYRAPFEPADFKTRYEQSRAHINQWVEGQTERRIRDLLPRGALDANTRLVLTNAIYFLGKWQQPFPHEGTSPAPFHSSASQTTNVPTMVQTSSFRYAEVDGAQVLEMPYRGGDFAMLVVLPRRPQGLGALEAQLDAAKLDQWVGRLQSSRVRVFLPKYTIDPAQSIELAATLRAMGMEDAFDRARADFSAMARPATPDDRLYVSAVFHKAFVKVDEEGTEAAAATAVVMARAGSAAVPQQPVEFRADHPFLFFVRDVRTGLILFAGRVQQPRS